PGTRPSTSTRSPPSSTASWPRTPAPRRSTTGTERACQSSSTPTSSPSTASPARSSRPASRSPQPTTAPGAIRVAGQVWRNLCKNLIIIQRYEQASVTRHVGQNLGDVVREGIERALKQVSHFAAKWSEATVENVLERYGVDDIVTIFKAL